MKTLETTSTALEIEDDGRAVVASLISGQPLDPEIYRRIRERGARITEELRQKHGEMNLAVDLIREVRDGE